MNWNKFNESTVLIIDDDQFTRELIKTMLKNASNLITHQASDGVEALSMMKLHTYNMLLLDLYMPNMNGEEFISIIKKNHKFKNIPIVLITTDRLTQKELSDIGANYYLTKPFDFHNFLQNIYDIFEEEASENETQFN